MDQQVLALIEQSAAIPTMPQVVTRFIELSADPDYELDDLVEVLSSDPGITSELLRMTNSALFGLARKVTSLKQSVALLGMARVRTLVLGRYLVERMQQGSELPSEYDRDYYWRRSLTQAVLASRLAEHLAPRHRQEAFVAGLLADTGIVVLAQAMPDRYQSLLTEYVPLKGKRLFDMEAERLGVTHADVSALVLEKWMLPELVVSSVRRHHESFGQTATEEDQIAHIVAASDTVSKLLCEKPDHTTVAENCRKALDGLGIGTAGLARVLGQIQDDIQQFADLLGVSVIRSNVYNRAIQLIQEDLLATAQAES